MIGRLLLLQECFSIKVERKQAAQHMSVISRSGIGEHQGHLPEHLNILNTLKEVCEPAAISQVDEQA